MTDQDPSRYIGLHANEAVSVMQQTAEAAPFHGRVAVTLFELGTEGGAIAYARRFFEIYGDVDSMVGLRQPDEPSLWMMPLARNAYEGRETSQGVELAFAVPKLHRIFLHRNVLKMPLEDARQAMGMGLISDL